MIEPDAARLVTIKAESGEFDADEETFLEHVDDLRRELLAAHVNIVGSDQPGGKGAADIMPILQVIVPGGAGLVAICSVVKTWIRQRGRRRLTFIRLSDDGEAERVVITGENVSDDTLLTFLGRGSDACSTDS